MYGFTIPDLVILFLNFMLIVSIGIWTSRGIHNQEDFLLGGRKFGKLFSTFGSFGQSTSADGPAGVATTVYNNGASGIWSSLLLLFVTPFFWLTAPLLRRMRIYSMADYYVDRYNSRRMAAMYSVVATVGMAGLLSVGFLAVARTAQGMSPKTLHELTVEERIEFESAQELRNLELIGPQFLSPGEKERLIQLSQAQPRTLFSHIDDRILVWTICLALILYSVMGGLRAAFYTDLIQGISIILLSLILLPFVWARVNDHYGGEGILQAFSHLHDRLPESYFRILGSPDTVDFTWYYILTVSVVSGITVVTQPNQLVTAGAAKDELAARIGFVAGTLLKRVLTVLWGVFALFAVVLFSDKLANPDYVWGVATRELLGPLGLGLVGLMLACMIAALMSTADCLTLTVSGLVVRSLYYPLFPDKTESDYVLAGRISGAIFLVMTAYISLQFDRILEVLKFIWEFFIIFAPAFWLGLKWRKATRLGAWISIWSALFVFYLAPLILPSLFPGLRTTGSLHLTTQAQVIEHSFIAKPIDAENQEARIRSWEERERPSGLEKPRSIEIGETLIKTNFIEPKGIYWSKGIKIDQSGNRFGGGYLYLEMVFLKWIGIPLEKFPYALNESIRLWIRLLFPFLIMFGISRVFPSDPETIGHRFFLKMRTPVSRKGPESDKGNLEHAYDNPNLTQHNLLYPNAHWEFYKWTREDAIGFLLSLGFVFAVLLLFSLAITLGGNT